MTFIPSDGKKRTLFVFPNGDIKFNDGGKDWLVGKKDLLQNGTHIFNLGWMFETIIPFAALEVEVPEVGDSWDLNIGANSSGWQAWKSTGASNMNAEDAGTLVFGKPFE